jgi:hypothetical protein
MTNTEEIQVWYFVFHSTMAGEFMKALYPISYDYDKIYTEWMGDGKHVIRVGAWSGSGALPAFGQTRRVRN